MNSLQFIASLIGSVAWPLAAVVGAVLFRGEVRSLLGRLRGGEILGTKWDFGDGIAKLEESRGNTPTESDEVTGSQVLVESSSDSSSTPKMPLVPRPDGSASEFVRLAREANGNPSYSVLVAWELTAGSIRDLMGAVSVLEPRFKRARLGGERSAISALPHAFLSSETKRAAIALGDLRNSVAHGGMNPTAGEAIAYVENAASVTGEIYRRASQLIERGHALHESDAPAS